jgi:hypothetical protein
MIYFDFCELPFSNIYKIPFWYDGQCFHIVRKVKSLLSNFIHLGLKKDEAHDSL